MEKAPPGWEPTVVKMKGQPGIENPYALAWWMHGQGAAPGGSKEADTDFKKAWDQFAASPDYEKFCKLYPMTEANSPTSCGQLYRKTGKESEHVLRFGVKLCESLKESGFNDATREVPCFIISEGPGNKVDKHYYTKEALKTSYLRFDGAKCYADHPTAIEEQTRPERSVRDIVGFFHSPQFVEVGGLGKIKAILKINQGDSFRWAWDMLKESLDYAEKYPNQDYIGISINADGVTSPDEKEDGTWQNVNEITRVVSADIVTQPAAGGRPLREAAIALRESVKAILESGAEPGGINVEKQKEALMKAAEALKAVRAAIGKVPDHDKAYGPALDDIAKKMGEVYGGESEGEGEAEAKKQSEAEAKKQAEAEAKKQADAEAAKKAAETAPPPKKDGDLEPVGDKAYTEESARYASGKMTEGEKKLFEAWQADRMVVAVAKGKAVIAKKLAESGIPEKFHAELSVLLENCKTTEQMDGFIASRKALIESVTGERIPGAGGKTNVPAKGSKLQEALAGAGLLKKGGK